MNVLDLFSGIGGFSLGLERAGMKTVAFCEIDKHCQKVLKKHWPDVPIFNDVGNLKGRVFTSIDVICGGFPCQDISVAGNKKGFKDEQGNRTRSGLWEEFARLIKEIKPKYAIIENVANLRNQGLNQVIQDLRKIGYGCEWHIVSARAVGACHLRERIWIIAYPDNERVEGLRSTKRIQEKHADTNCSNISPADSTSKRLEGAKWGPSEREGYAFGSNRSPNSNLPRLWRPFATKEEKSEWWAETTSRFSDVFRKINEIEPTICRGYDGLSDRLHERGRKERIKQLGNAVVPQIPEMIGKILIEAIDEQES